jgi:hypothetical protein
VYEDDLLTHKVTDRLLEELRKARDGYAANASAAGEYEKALKRLNDFLIEGIWPEEFKPFGESDSSHA